MTRNSHAEQTRSPRAREVKKIVDFYKLLPVPAIFEIDLRSKSLPSLCNLRGIGVKDANAQSDDVEVITPILYRLTGASSVPILLVGGRNAGTVEEIRAANATGALRLDLAAAGAVIGGSEKKKKKKMIIQFTDE